MRYFVAALLLVVGCPTTDSGETGSEGEVCYPNGTCDVGLHCLQNRCVVPDSNDAIVGKDSPVNADCPNTDDACEEWCSRAKQCGVDVFPGLPAEVSCASVCRLIMVTAAWPARQAKCWEDLGCGYAGGGVTCDVEKPKSTCVGNVLHTTWQGCQWDLDCVEYNKSSSENGPVCVTSPEAPLDNNGSCPEVN